MRRHYLDNIRWITVGLVVLYHVIFMYNGVVTVSYTHLDVYKRQRADCSTVWSGSR